MLETKFFVQFSKKNIWVIFILPFIKEFWSIKNRIRPFEFIKFNFETVFLVNTKQKNRSIGWQIKSDWFSTLDLGFTLLPALVKLYYLWASTNPLVAKVIYFQKRVWLPFCLLSNHQIFCINWILQTVRHTHLFANYLSILHFISQNSTLLLNKSENPFQTLTTEITDFILMSLIWIR